MNFLVIDDSGVMRRIHKNILLDNKIDESQIFEAENGEVAVKIAEKENIDLFLLDWNMPKLDGLKFVQIIRSIERYEDTPIIMITSEAAKYNVVDAITAKHHDYQCKRCGYTANTHVWLCPSCHGWSSMTPKID